MRITEWLIIIAVIVVMIALLFPMFSCIGKDWPVTYSEPFVVERVDYLQGSFGYDPKTIITTDTGATMILNGIVLVPESGVKVITRNDSGVITIIKEDD